MSEKKKICVVTGSRAEYGHLYWLLKGIQSDNYLELQMVVTGMHLSPEFGLTYKIIEKDGFPIDEKVEMLLSSDTPVGISKSIGLATIGFSEAFSRLKPHIIVMLGDRFELLAAAQSALVACIPVAHISGGDSTEGAFDEGIRHSITKMSHLHFTIHEKSARRVRQLGENPKHIFNFGSPGLDHLKRMKFLLKEELEKELGFKFRKKNLLLTFHSVTTDSKPANEPLEEILNALDTLDSNVGIIITRSNADTHGRVLLQMLDNFEETHENAKVFTSLGQLKYFSTLKQIDVVVGNSSSGIVEVPSFKIPTVNIGDRQKGRHQPQSVIQCEPNATRIKKAILAAFDMDCSYTVNPYGDGESSKKIIGELKKITDAKSLIKKHFFDINEGDCT